MGELGIDGKVVVITGVGAMRGLGNSMANVFASEGAKVVGADLRAERGPAIERTIREAGGDFSFVAADMRKVADCQRLIQTALDLHGRIDALVNDAMTNPNPLARSHEVTEEDWDNCIETMLKGTFFCCRYAIPHMLAQRYGVIVNISSGSALGSFDKYRAYGAAKMGVLHVSRGLAEEYSGTGIRVHGVIPGVIASDEFIRQWGDTVPLDNPTQEQREAYVTKALERTGAVRPEAAAYEVAQIVAGDDRFVSGDTLQMPGLRPLMTPSAALVSRSNKISA